MPITSANKKALRSSTKKRAHNVEFKTKLKNAIKKATKTNVNDVISLIDKAAKKNLMHKNKAARLKSQMMSKFGSPKSTKKTAKPTVKKKTTKKPAKKTTKKK